MSEITKVIISKTYGNFNILINKEYEYLFSIYKYCIAKAGTYFYVVRNDKDYKKRPKLRYLHQDILNNYKNIIDHKNHNTLDNRIENLRLCTSQENNRNRKKRKNVSSIYKGVLWRKDKNRWQAKIVYNGKQHHLGYFKFEKEAAIAYDNAAIKYFGDFKILNFEVKNG